MTDARKTESDDRWARSRKIIEDMKRVGAVPDSERPDGVVQTPEFSGHKSIYLANLEGCLGGAFPALLAERDELCETLRTAMDNLAAVDELPAEELRDLVRDFREVAAHRLGGSGA